jgi:hypothetical protein
VLCAFDLIELNGIDLRPARIEEPKGKLADLLHRVQDGIAFNPALPRRQRDHLQARLRARLRGYRLEAAGLALPLLPGRSLAQNQESSRARGGP